MSLRRTLREGPVDVVGDVHGEGDALGALLEGLGYAPDGNHPEGRRLVFVGDLVDRGPDSVGVLARVQRLVEADRADCVLGNHELNVLRGERKHGNGWWFGAEEEAQAGRRFESVLLTDSARREGFRSFLRSLPLTLERSDLRIVHAAWWPPALGALDGVTDVVRAARLALAGLEDSPVARRAEARRAALGARLRQREAGPPPFEDGLAAYDEALQMANPVAILVSGAERVRPSGTPFWSSGKWRFVERVPWWDDYAGPPVVIGHYWRRYDPGAPPDPEKGAAERDLFGGAAPDAWLGGGVFCVDYSVGRRFAERLEGSGGPFRGALAALRVPEWEVVFDDGRPRLRPGPPPGCGGPSGGSAP